MRSYFLAFFILSFGVSVKAYVGSVSAATGNSGRAAIEASETPFLNPAAVAFLRGYYFTAAFGTASQGTSEAQDLALSLTENLKETVVPTSLAYTQSSFDDGMGGKATSRDFRISAGNFIAKTTALGLGVRHKNDVIADKRYAQTNMDLGALWAPSESLGFAAVFETLLPIKESVPEAYRIHQTMAFAGTYNYKKFMRLKADIVSQSNNSFGKPMIGAGMENYLNRWMILRWGLAKNNELGANLYSAGIGWVLPRFGLHYAYQNSPQDETLTRHSVDLAIPVW